MVDSFTEEQISEFKEIFNYFDKDGDGKIPIKDLGTVMRSIMQNVTEVQLQDIINEVASDGQESIDFHDFLKFPARKMKDVDIEEEFIQAFKIFDKDNRGKIDFDKIRCVFINLDEKITEEEIVEIIRKAKVNVDGTVDYRDFIKDLMNE